MSQITITITISGAGGTFGYPMDTIIEALEKEGFQVEIIDNYQPDRKFSVQESRELYEEHKIPRGKIIIKTDHIPWGG